MLPIHYAAFFNSASVIKILLKASGSKGIKRLMHFVFFEPVSKKFKPPVTYQVEAKRPKLVNIHG